MNTSKHILATSLALCCIEARALNIDVDSAESAYGSYVGVWSNHSYGVIDSAMDRVYFSDPLWGRSTFVEIEDPLQLGTATAAGDWTYHHNDDELLFASASLTHHIHDDTEAYGFYTESYAELYFTTHETLHFEIAGAFLGYSSDPAGPRATQGSALDFSYVTPLDPLFYEENWMTGGDGHFDLEFGADPTAPSVGSLSGLMEPGEYVFVYKPFLFADEDASGEANFYFKLTRPDGGQHVPDNGRSALMASAGLLALAALRRRLTPLD